MSDRQRRYAAAFWACITGLTLVSIFVAYLFRHQGSVMVVSMGATTLVALWMASAVPFFVMAMHYFKQDLHRSYILFVLGVVGLSLSQGQIPIANLNVHLWRIWIAGGLFALPYLLALTFIFVALRGLLRQLQLKTRWSSLPVILVLATVVAGIAGCLPIVLPWGNGNAFDAGVAVIMWVMVVGMASTLLLMKIRQAVSDTYRTPMSSLSVGLAAVTVAAVHFSVELLFVPEQTPYREYGVDLIPLAIASWYILRAGIAYNLMDEVGDKVALDGPATSLNIITYVASMASNPDEIDDILDDARIVSATLQPGEQPAAAQQEQLARVYLRLEEHLTSQERLQAFTTESLRQRVARSLRLDSNDATFWPLLDTINLLEVPATGASRNDAERATIRV